MRASSFTLTRLAERHPRWLDAGIQLDRVPAPVWLAAQALVLWPAWLWMGRRLADGSDDPLGLLALAALAALVWLRRRDLRSTPRLGWLLLAGMGTVLATFARGGLPPLLASLLAVLALACGLLAFLPRVVDAATARSQGVAALPVLGLAALALPLLSSLQFYAGYPLRLITAELSQWLLAPFFDVAREGASLWIAGRLVIVDAPCSGVQMVWLGYFTACVTALFIARGTDRQFLLRLPMVSVLVLAGNVLRNALLVGAEGAGRALPAWGHEALGLVMLALVCGGIAAWMSRPARGLHGGNATGHRDSSSGSGLITTSGGWHVDTLA